MRSKEHHPGPEEGGQEPPPPLPKTHDYAYSFRGLWTQGGVCRVRVFLAEGRIPVVVCSELPENENTSVTNIVEYLAPEVVAKHFPHRFDEERGSTTSARTSIVSTS